MKYILASSSPRRMDLLKQIGMDFTAIPSTVEEIKTTSNPAKLVCELSLQKAADVFDKIARKEENMEFVVIGADTVVAKEDAILGKPKDEEDAKAMLRLLSGSTHQVFTGVTLIVQRNKRKVTKTFYEKTDVTMYPMSEMQIEEYVATKESMDKAGAYAIQGLCGVYIRSIQGEYANVVGLPIARMYQELMKLELKF